VTKKRKKAGKSRARPNHAYFDQKKKEKGTNKKSHSRRKGC